MGVLFHFRFFAFNLSAVPLIRSLLDSRNKKLAINESGGNKYYQPQLKKEGGGRIGVTNSEMLLELLPAGVTKFLTKQSLSVCLCLMEACCGRVIDYGALLEVQDFVISFCFFF